MLGSLRNRHAINGAPIVLHALSAIVIFGIAGCDSPLSPRLALVLSQPSVEFRAVRGSTTALTQTITVSNAGSGRLGPVTCAGVSAAWLTCSVSGGTLVTLTANPTALTQSPPQAVVTLSAPGAPGTIAVNVDLRIDEPVLSLSAGTVSFFASEGSATTTPATGTVSVTNTGAGSLASLGTITCVPTPANARVGCSVNQSSGALTVSVDPAGLVPATYIYPVTVSSQNSGVSQTFSIALTVGARARMALSKQTLLFQIPRGTTQSVTQTVTVSNIGTGSLGTLACSSSVAWLTCSVLPDGTTLQFVADPSGLLTSPLPTNVSVTASNAINSPQTVTVTLALDQPVLSLSADTVTFTVVQGTNFVTPTSRVVTASNTGVGDLASLGTITCTPPASSAVTCAVAGNQITLSVNPANLPPGVSIVPVAVVAQHSDVTRTIAVTINVTAGISATPSALHFIAIRGSTAPPSQSVTISKLSGGALGTLACPASPATWLTCSAGATTVVFTVNTVGLSVSPPAVVVPITATLVTTGDQGTASVTVTLALDQPVLSVNPTSAQITGAGSVNVQASNTGAGTLANLGTIACSQPTNVACTVNQATGVLTITTNTTGLVAGTYLRSVIVTAANASNTQTVTIVLTVP